MRKRALLPEKSSSVQRICLANAHSVHPEVVFDCDSSCWIHRLCEKKKKKTAIQELVEFPEAFRKKCENSLESVLLKITQRKHFLQNSVDKVEKYSRVLLQHAVELTFLTHASLCRIVVGKTKDPQFLKVLLSH